MSDNVVVITNGNNTYAIPEKEFDQYKMSEDDANKALRVLEETTCDVEGQRAGYNCNGRLTKDYGSCAVSEN